MSCSYSACWWLQQRKFSALLFVQRLLMALTTKIICLIVITAPVDDDNDPVFEVLHGDSYSVRTLYRFRLNPFLIKFLYNVFKYWYFAPNCIDNMKSHVGKQLYRLGLVTIPFNNQDHFKNIEYIIVWLSYSVSVYLLFILLYVLLFRGLTNVSMDYFSVLSYLIYIIIIRLLNMLLVWQLHCHQ